MALKVDVERAYDWMAWCMFSEGGDVEFWFS